MGSAAGFSPSSLFSPTPVLSPSRCFLTVAHLSIVSHRPDYRTLHRSFVLCFLRNLFFHFEKGNFAMLDASSAGWNGGLIGELGGAWGMGEMG